MRWTVLVWITALACTAPEPNAQPFYYRSTPSPTPVSIPGDPRERRITSIELGATDLASEQTAGTLLLDDRSWDIDDFGDARPRGGRPRATHVTLTRVPDPEHAGKERVLFALELAERQLEHRLYFSWSPVAAVDSYFLIRGEKEAPAPIVVGRDRTYVSYRHVVPLERAGGPALEGDAPQNDSISLETTTFDFREPVPQERDHGLIWIRGHLGASGQVHYDGNAVSFTPFGERGMQTLIGYRPWKVAFVPAGAPDASGRRVFELVRESPPAATPGLASAAVPEPDRYFLVLAPTIAGAHRLIVRREGSIRHVLPLFNRRAKETLALLTELAPGSEAERAVVADLRNFVDDDFTLAVEHGHIAEIVFLRTLEPVPAAALERLAALPHLQRLTFDHCTEPSADALDALLRLAALTELKFQETPLTDAAFQRMAELPKLASLTAYHEGGMHPSAPVLTSTGLVALSRLPILRSLQLGHESIDDAALPQLGALQQLTSLSMFRSRMTPWGALRLAKALPRTRVTVEVGSTRVQSEPGALSVSGPVSGSLLEEIARAGGIRELDVDLKSTTTAAVDLERLSSMTTLRGLRLWLPQSFSERGIVSVAKLPELKKLELFLADTPSAGAFRPLGERKSLELLWLSVSDGAFPLEAVLQLLSDLPAVNFSAHGSPGTIQRDGATLRVGPPLDDLELDALLATQDPRDLSLAAVRLSPQGLRRLASLPHLERLEIVDDLRDPGAGLEALATLRQLKELVLAGPTRLTEAALERLERRLPGCEIRARGRPSS